MPRIKPRPLCAKRECYPVCCVDPLIVFGAQLVKTFASIRNHCKADAAVCCEKMVATTGLWSLWDISPTAKLFGLDPFDGNYKAGKNSTSPSELVNWWRNFQCNNCKNYNCYFFFGSYKVSFTIFVRFWYTKFALPIWLGYNLAILQFGDPSKLVWFRKATVLEQKIAIRMSICVIAKAQA